ncbi:hypothetical protein [uncultured Vagococcus sp.]|uniref:hypothetical protein n=1 Tax=uncultured Vagococcus sp. TaxID=189676 RepID=UPI002589366F|nr:hypothetical protein [uncultured Vagococcus sp.]
MSQPRFKISGQVTQLYEEVIRLTSKAPKKLRFSLCQTIDQLALSILSDIYRANACHLFDDEALVSLKLLGTLGRIGTENQCFTIGEFGVLSKKFHTCDDLILKWQQSDKR